MHRRPFAALLGALALAACSSAEPVDLLLDPDAAPEGFTAEAVVEDAAFILRGCGIEDLADDNDGARSASVTFNDESSGDGFTHTVSSVGDATTADVLDEVEERLATCEPQAFGGADATTFFLREPATGPELGERAVWMETSLQLEGDGGDGGATDPTPSVIFAKDDVVHFLSGPVELSWDDSVAFLVDLAASL